MFMATLSREVLDAQTGQIKTEVLTDEEATQIQENEAKFLVRLAQVEVEQSLRATQKQALLDRLGITEEEAKLLLS